MATSDTAEQAFDFLDIIEEAYEQAGMELRGGYQLSTARRSLNLLTIEWANDGVNLWTIEPATLTANAVTEELPDDTIDVLDVMVRVADQDRPLARIAATTYANISNKSQTGIPTQVWVRRGAESLLYFWPVPDQAYTIVYHRTRRIQDVGAYSNTADAPFRFIPALIAGLAYKLALKVGSDRLPYLQSEYDRIFTMAKEEDREKTPLRLVPGRMY